MLGECTLGKCPKIVKDIFLLATKAKNQNRIVMLNCQDNGETCGKLPGDARKENNIMAMFINNEGIYNFEGNQTLDGFLTFLSSGNFRNSKKLSDFEKVIEIVMET